jgi:Uma2 family endonuclease
MMSSSPKPRLLDAEQLYALPDDGNRYELIRGLLVSEPVPGRSHGRTIARLAHVLESFVRGRSLGVVYAGDSGFVLAREPDTVRGPDVAYVAADRESIAPSSLASPYFPGAPDLAIEVRSPSDRTNEILGKVSDYLAAGSRLVWVVDPARLEVQVFRSPLKPLTLTGSDILDGEDVLPGFAVRISELFD